MTDLYRLMERPPTIAEYRSLISAVDWAEWTNFDAADTALTRSLYHVVALQEDAVIGMARVVGDGAMSFYIQNVVVVPVRQGRGVGTLLLKRVTGYPTGAAPEKAFTGFFAAEGRPLGFAVKSVSTGMSRHVSYVASAYNSGVWDG